MDKIYTGFENLDKSLWIYKGNLVVFAAPQRRESLCFFCSIMENMYNLCKYIRKNGLMKERIIKDRFRLRKQKDVDNEIFLWQEFKFDNTLLRFYEIL